MFTALAHFSYRYRWPVVVAFLLLFPLAGIYGVGVFGELKGGGFQDPTSESLRALEVVKNDLQTGDADIVALYSVAGGSVQDAAVRDAITAALQRAAADPAVERVTSFYTTNAPQFISRDGTRTFAVISMRGDDDEKEKALHHVEQLLAAEGTAVQFGGGAPANEAISGTIEGDLALADAIAFPLTLVLLIVIFGSLVSAFVPVIMGGLAILVAFAALRLIAGVTDVSVFAVNIVTVLGLGLAIDYSLFILNRFREELPERGVEGAIVHAVSTTGRAVAFSGVTVAVSLVGLFVFPQMFLRSMALGAISVALAAVVIAVTFLPALIAVLGTRVMALRVPFVPRADFSRPSERSFWHRVAYAVMRRPVLVAVAVVAALLFLGTPFLSIQASIPDDRVLSRENDVRQVGDSLRDDFLPHQTTPHVIALQGREAVLTPETIGSLYDYVQRVAAVPGIAQVESIFSIAPGLSREAYQGLYSRPATELDPGLARGLAAYAQGGTTRIAAISTDEFDAARSQAAADDLRELTPPAGMRVLVGGRAAELVDLKESIIERAPLMVGVIAVAMFIVLFLVFGSVVLPLKAMVMNLLSLTASFGAMVWIFQEGRFENILRYESLGAVNATQPLLMFAIIFGLSMDYEVLLLSRMREEYNRTGDNTAAVAHGLEKTGRLITSAALALVLVFGAFATSSIVFMKELGVGMVLAIILDATIVRALLVPALMKLMGRWNWWAPAPLTRLWERIGLGDLEGHAAERRATPEPAAGD